jgi:hypothetical protein
MAGYLRGNILTDSVSKYKLIDVRKTDDGFYPHQAEKYPGFGAVFTFTRPGNTCVNKII